MSFLEKGSFIRIFIIFSVFLFILLLFLLIVSLLFFILSNRSNIANSSSRNQYLLTEINISKNIKKHGSIQLPRLLKSEEYLTHRNTESDSFFIISNYGGDQYECTGSCYCSSNRRIATVLNRGLTVLLSAFSLTMATNIAKEAFQDECVKRFSDECDGDSIRADIESCEKPRNFEGYILADDKFTCRGFCYDNPLIKEGFPEYLSEGTERFGECKDRTLKREIIPRRDMSAFLGDDQDADMLPPQIIDHLMFLYLLDFCNEQTRMELRDVDRHLAFQSSNHFTKNLESEMKEGAEERLMEIRKGLSFCITDTEDGNPPNYKNIHCFSEKEYVVEEK